MDRSELTRFRASLLALDAAAEANLERMHAIRARIAGLVEQIDAGRPLAEIAAEEERPRTVEMLSANMAVLETAGAEMRAAQAVALRAEGMTIDAIGELFGVSRQRISALLRQRAAHTSEV